jgi:hypothetical protein
MCRIAGGRAFRALLACHEVAEGAMDMAGVGGLSPPMLADHEAGGFIWNLTMGSIKYAKLGIIF